MEEDLKEFLEATQTLNDLAMKNTDELEELVADNDSDIELEVEYPYLIFKRDELVRAMNLCNKIVQIKSDIVTYNSISFIPYLPEKTMSIYATNELSHFRYTVELLGDEKEMLDLNFSIPLVVLQKLVKLMGNKVLIYKKDVNFYIRLLDGDLLLDFRQPDLSILKFPGEVDEKIADIGINHFGNIVNSILPLLNSEVRGDAKKILFTGEKAYYNSSFYYIEAMIKTPKMSLTYKDAEFITKLYKYYNDSQLQVFSVNSSINRLFIKVNNVEYEFINSTNAVSDILVKQMESAIKQVECMLNYVRLYKIVSLATSLPSSTGNLGLKYNGNKIQLTLFSNRGNSIFNVGIDKIYSDLGTDEVMLNAETFRRLLCSFNSYDKIGLSISDFGVNLEYKDIRAILMYTEV